MSNKTNRGTKRKCQNDECALPFYDLNRVSYACPTCGTVYDLALAAQAQAALMGNGYSRKQSRTYVTTAPPVDADAVAIEPIDADADAAVAKEDEVVESDAEATIDQDALLETEDEADVEIEPIAGAVKDD